MLKRCTLEGLGEEIKDGENVHLSPFCEEFP
jgi:hypothetical protein